MTHCILSQYATNKGINIGERDIRAWQKELEKLHKVMAMQPRLLIYLISEHKRRDLSYVMFLKKKIYGLIKEGGGRIRQAPATFDAKGKYNTPNRIHTGSGVLMHY